MQYWVVNGCVIEGSNPSVAIREWMKKKGKTVVKVGENIDMTRISPERYEELMAHLKAKKEADDVQDIHEG